MSPYHDGLGTASGTGRPLRRPGGGGTLRAMAGVQHVVLTAVGSDRPGIVDEVAAFIAERGGNLEDSRMVNLHGQFAMVLLVSADSDVVTRLCDDLDELCSRSRLRAEIHPADMAAAGRAEPAVPYRLAVTAMDHPGLVQAVAHLLHEQNVNIESVETALRPAPYTNAPLFEMDMVVSVPASTPVARVREGLARLCDDLNMDWQLTAL